MHRSWGAYKRGSQCTTHKVNPCRNCVRSAGVVRLLKRQGGTRVGSAIATRCQLAIGRWNIDVGLAFKAGVFGEYSSVVPHRPDKT